MKGTRVVRYVGNRERPEPELFAPEEILRSLVNYPMVDMASALNVEGLKGIKPITLDEITKTTLEWAKTQLVEEVQMSPRPMDDYIFGFSNAMIPDLQVERPKERELEVNMVEPLEGWKVWAFGSPYLMSEYDSSPWVPLRAYKAECGGCDKIPAEHHTCGVYASTSAPNVERYRISGQVYGWGRYIRGESGWRAEFAYPKNFYLCSEQMELFDLLKEYQVPIYVYQPVRMYDPREEGYASEYREAQEDGGVGAGEGSAPQEDSGSGEED